MTLRILNGQVILPADQQQRLILGRGVAAELRVTQLEEENHTLRTELAEIRAKLEELIGTDAPAETEAPKPRAPRARKPKP